MLKRESFGSGFYCQILRPLSAAANGGRSICLKNKHRTGQAQELISSDCFSPNSVIECEWMRVDGWCMRDESSFSGKRPVFCRPRQSIILIGRGTPFPVGNLGRRDDKRIKWLKY